HRLRPATAQQRQQEIRAGSEAEHVRDALASELRGAWLALEVRAGERRIEEGAEGNAGPEELRDAHRPARVDENLVDGRRAEVGQLLFDALKAVERRIDLMLELVEGSRQEAFANRDELLALAGR